MSPLQRISLSLPKELVAEFDTYFASKGIDNRSQACELIFRDYLTHANLGAKSEIVGMLSILYNHHKRNLTANLNDLQHDFHEIIISSQHLHLDHEQCLETIFVKGDGKKIQKLSDRLLAIKGVKLGRSLLHVL